MVPCKGIVQNTAINLLSRPSLHALVDKSTMDSILTNDKELLSCTLQSRFNGLTSDQIFQNDEEKANTEDLTDNFYALPMR